MSDAQEKDVAFTHKQLSGLALKVIGAVLGLVGTAMVSLLLVVWGEVATARGDVATVKESVGLRLTEIEKADIRQEAQLTILRGKQEQIWTKVGDRYTSQQAAAEGRVFTGLITAIGERVKTLESRFVADEKLGSKIDKLIRAIERKHR